MADFPVTEAFIETANAVQLHDEARGSVPPEQWPASFTYVDDGWVYRVDRDDVDRAVVQSALDAHVPAAVTPEPSLLDRLAAVEARLDKAAAAAVTGDAAKLRDGLKPVT